LPHLPWLASKNSARLLLQTALLLLLLPGFDQEQHDAANSSWRRDVDRRARQVRTTTSSEVAHRSRRKTSRKVLQAAAVYCVGL
jgi:hypothetical protein